MAARGADVGLGAAPGALGFGSPGRRRRSLGSWMSGGRRSPGDRSGGGSHKIKVAFPGVGVKSNVVHAIAKPQTVQLSGAGRTLHLVFSCEGGCKRRRSGPNSDTGMGMGCCCMNMIDRLHGLASRGFRGWPPPGFGGPGGNGAKPCRRADRPCPEPRGRFRRLHLQSRRARRSDHHRGLQPPARHGPRRRRRVGRQYNSDDYNCNHGDPNDPATLTACQRLRGAGPPMASARTRATSATTTTTTATTARRTIRPPSRPASACGAATLLRAAAAS